MGKGVRSVGIPAIPLQNRTGDGGMPRTSRGMTAAREEGSPPQSSREEGWKRSVTASTP